MNQKNSPKVVLVSGGFDPLHLGHLRSFKAAKKLGDKLMVLVDGDQFLLQKKGAVFMPLEDRVAIIEELRCVDEVITRETHGDVSGVIREIRPDIFANGGDKNSPADLLPSELAACQEVGCEMVFGVGGAEKVRSSSELLRRWVEKFCKEPR
jgi:D-beta-D-heptose 7-phosphate kinase/D-beta-D-heptose 1-phosphate adenosyltransferase